MNEDLKTLLANITDPATKQSAITLFNNITQGAKEGKNIEIALRAVRKEFVNVNEQAKEFTQSFASSLQEISSTNVALNEARKAQRSLLSLAQKLEDTVSGTNRLSLKELVALKSKAAIEQKRVERSAELIRNQKDSLKNLKVGSDEYKAAVKNLVDTDQLTPAQQSVLEQEMTGFKNINDFNDAIDQVIVDQAELNSIMGLTGAALGNLNRIGVRALGGLGINLGALEEDLKEAESAALATAEGIKQARKEGKEITFGERFAVLRSALPGIGKAFSTALIDPLTVGLFSTQKLIQAFQDINKAQTEFRRLTGETADTFEQLTSNAATAVEVIELSSSLTRQIGTNAEAVFGPETLLQITEAKNLLGLTAEQASDLAVLSRVSGVNAELFQKQLSIGARNGNRVAGSGISTKIALEDALSVSDDIQLSLGGSGERLGEAAVAARALGLELKEVDAIASSVLDFESSIEKELQAQLLTGRNLNLTRARELALNNDLAGVANEVTNNLISSTEFANMNRIAQEGFASAIGVSRDQLARMIIQQDMNNSLTDQQKADMQNMTLEQFRQQQAAEALRRTFQGIAQAVVGIVEPFISLIAGQEKLIAGAITLAGVFKSVQLGLKLTSKIQGALIALGTIRNAQERKGLVLQSALNKAKANETAQEAAQAVLQATQTSGNPLIGLGIGLAAVAAALGAMKLFKSDDFMQEGYGKRMLFSKEGTIAFNDNDTIVAGTNLTPSPGVQTQPMVSVSMEKVENKLDQLISLVKQGGDVYIDGNKMGSAMVLSSYKSS